MFWRLEGPVIPILGLRVVLGDGPRQLLVNPLPQRGDVLVRETRPPERHFEISGLLDGTDQPVEFGAIKIYLNRFKPEARRHVLDERRPLGRIMQECGVKHSSRPRAFLRLASDRFINEALRLTGANVLYGRRNTLLDPQERPLAEIVEILPPAQK